MSVTRLVLLLAVVGALILFALQNVSPSLSLTFLGMRSQALPLSVWILLSLAAGVLTSLFIASCLLLSNSLAEQAWRNRRRPSSPNAARRTPNPPPPPRTPDVEPTRVWESRQMETKTTVQAEYYSPPPSNTQTFYQEVTATQSVEAEVSDRDRSLGNGDEETEWVEDDTPVQSPTIDDDWENPGPRRNHEDWDEGETASNSPTRSEVPEEPQRGYETPQEPKAQSWSGSMYSYSYREPKDSGVGKTETVYDADFRVITPPFRAVPPEPVKPDRSDDWGNSNKQSDDEDWGFDDDELTEDPRK